MQSSAGHDSTALGRFQFSLQNRSGTGAETGNNNNNDEAHRHEFSVGCKREADEAGLEPESIGISSDDDASDKQETTKKTPPPNGKKTKGRVKIKMEFIDNKLRRYTTFSKRKTGIMKKAYELSTLTGTQVMLLVASETGHVYTFATRKLQPMITSEAGKALIQTCLSSPDPLLNSSQQVDQRMSATGFEETELTYSINDEDTKAETPKSQGLYGGSGQLDSPNHHSPTLTQISATTSVPVTTLLNSQNTSKSNNISMQLPAATSFTTILAPGLATSQQSSTSDAPTQSTVTMVPTTQQSLSVVPGNVVNLTPVATTSASSVPGTVMYQTPQGVVYATPTTATLPEGVIFNFGHSLPQEAGGSSSAHQYITIPVSLTPTSQVSMQAAHEAFGDTLKPNRLSRHSLE